MKLYYPAVFIRDGEGYTVEFPDLPGCVTQGDNFEEAFEMAEDAASGWILTSIEDGEDIPSPSPIQAIDCSEGYVNYIPLDIGEYAKRYSTKSIKKTLTIPEWLNTLAERAEINFSQELQRALKERLGLTANMLVDTVTKLEEQTNTLATSIRTLEHDFIMSKRNSSSNSVVTSITLSLPQSVFPN